MDALKQYMEVNGTRLYYERAGRGDPLLLVHGGGGDCRHWDAQFEELAVKYDIIRYDLRGYGRSDPPVAGQPYRHEEDLAALMNALGVSSAHIAGYSLGSQIVVDAYTLYPQLFRSMITVGPYVSGHTSPACDHLFGAYLGLGKVFLEQGAEAAATGFANIPAFNPAHIPARVKARIIDIAKDYGWWWARLDDPMQAVTPQAVDRLGDLDVPVLVVTAEHDAAVCREVADLLAAQVKDVQLFDLPGATHFMLMEHPSRVSGRMSEFILAV